MLLGWQQGLIEARRIRVAKVNDREQDICMISNFRRAIYISRSSIVSSVISVHDLFQDQIPFRVFSVTSHSIKVRISLI